MRRSAALVDALAGAVVDDHDLGPGGPVDVGRHPGRGTVGAVDDNLQTIEPLRHLGQQVIGVPIAVAVAADQPRPAPHQIQRRVGDLVLGFG